MAQTALPHRSRPQGHSCSAERNAGGAWVSHGSVLGNGGDSKIGGGAASRHAAGLAALPGGPQICTPRRIQLLVSGPRPVHLVGRIHIALVLQGGLLQHLIGWLLAAALGFCLRILIASLAQLLMKKKKEKTYTMTKKLSPSCCQCPQRLTSRTAFSARNRATPL